MNNGHHGYGYDMYGKFTKVISNIPRFFGFKRPSEIFISQKDGNWNNPDTWKTVSGRTPHAGFLPTSLDDVYITSHIVTVTTGTTIADCFNIFVKTGKLNFLGTNCTLSVRGSIQATGAVDLTGSNAALILYGDNNFINRELFLPGVGVQAGGVQYWGATNQAVMDLPYHNLWIQGANTKYLTANTTVTGYLYIQGQAAQGTFNIFELGQWDLTVTGITTTTASGASTFLQKSGSGNILFVGLVTTSFTGFRFAGGNPTIEFRGGYTRTGAGLGSTHEWGTGKISFTTNNQTVSNGGGVGTLADFEIWQDVEIVGAITLTVAAATGVFQINNYINGTTGSSALVNRGNLYFNTLTSPMVVGTFDKDTWSTNVVGYIYNGSHTLPYTTYQGLYIAGTGVKTQATGANTIGTTLQIVAGATLTSAGNTTVGGITTHAGTLNMTAYDWTFSNNLNMPTIATLTKSGAGTVLFIGRLNATNGGGSNTLNFSGNPSVECRNGITFYTSTAAWNSGTGTWTFSTNNQSVNIGAAGIGVNWDGPVIISGAITVTFANVVIGAIHRINNYIAGTVIGSTLVLQVEMDFNNISNYDYTVGTLDKSSALAVIGYIFNGSITLPYTAYPGLVVSGTGTKTLGANTTVATTLVIGANGVLDLGAFDLTVTGTTTINNTASFLKSGAGNITFIGFLNLLSSSTFNLTGNPNFETRGGIGIGTANISTFYTGTGLWTISTTNHNIGGSSNVHTVDAEILIAGAITVTIGAIQLTFNKKIDGNNAASKLDNRSLTGTGVNYKAATMPMVTGLLETNATNNVWYYNGAIDQDIKGGTYRTLVLAGGAFVKTLQGNVVVVTSYTLTAPTTLNLNGYTRT